MGRHRIPPPIHKGCRASGTCTAAQERLTVLASPPSFLSCSFSIPSSATPDQSASKESPTPPSILSLLSSVSSRSRVARAPHTSSIARAAVRAYYCYQVTVYSLFSSLSLAAHHAPSSHPISTRRRSFNLPNHDPSVQSGPRARLQARVSTASLAQPSSRDVSRPPFCFFDDNPWRRTEGRQGVGPFLLFSPPFLTFLLSSLSSSSSPTINPGPANAVRTRKTLAFAHIHHA
ncbi:hypothetical protein LZ31DRAFT_47699 [Colletotrichum somersetense]|nr:hypothetical protein LZ31DRAFT_47699 [Colletotrichum somersetense]